METETTHYNSHEEILRRLKHRKPAVREAAERELGQLPLERLFFLLEEEAQRQQYRWRWVRQVDRWNWLTPFVPLYIANDTFPKLGYAAAILGGLTATFFMFLPSMLMLRFHPSDALHALYRTAQQQDTMAMIRCSLRLYQSGMAFGVEAYLTEHLPAVRASDSHKWTQEDRKSLLFLLQDCAYKSPDLAIAALKALEQIGGAEAIPIVRKLASGKKHYGFLWFNLKSEVTKAAQGCLPYLEQNAVSYSQEQALLRPSSAPSDHTPHTLLRPAAATPEETPPEQLLRAHVEEP